MNIVEIFPIKIAVIDDFECSQEIVDALNNVECVAPSNNDVAKFSLDTYIFDNLFYDSLSSKIIEQVNYYANALQLRNNKMQFAQSWVTQCTPGLHHRIHSHTNSVISGVYYFDTDSHSSPLMFHRGGLTDIRVNTLEAEDDHDTFVLPSSKNRLVLFPSYLTHSVPMNMFKRDRRSVAFNCLPIGRLGNERSLCEIRYDRLK